MASTPATEHHKHLVATGLAVGLKGLIGLKFDLDKPYTGCRICGTVYQSDTDRALDSNDPIGHLVATERRRLWSVAHASTHSTGEHVELAMSGRWCTPAAAYKMACLGIVPLSDMVLDEAVADALRKAPAVPTDDVEGS